ncbi:MAG: efflux RND transporter periplasmic adaptor subunit [Acidobacteriaceae bacterium]
MTIAKPSSQRLLLAFILAVAGSASAQSPQTITAAGVSVTPHLRAYAQVQPIATLPINAPQAGILTNLRVVPGTRVRAGQILATLTGPSMQNLLRQDRANLRSARAQLSAAHKSLAIQQQQLRAHLSTRQAVQQAASAVAKAQATLDNAQSQLSALRRMATIVAPSAGTVLALSSSSGELLSANQPILTLQPSHALWLRATYYGTDLTAIHPGLTGAFHPASGGPTIPVRVRAVSGVINPDGGESVFLAPLQNAPHWLAGTFGSLALNLPAQTMIAVPTRALILDHGKWWVMIHTPRGDHPRQVTPGPAHGFNTYLTSGLAPGARVIVSNAYLLFHNSIADHFQIPD